MARMPTSNDTPQLQPRILICSVCRQEFIFTVSAQQYFADQGHPKGPKRCKACHAVHKQARQAHGHERTQST